MWADRTGKEMLTGPNKEDFCPKNQSDPGGRGTCQNFDRDARPTFLGLKFDQILFFWVGKFFSYFSGFCKISASFLGLTNFQLFFLGLPIFVSHT